jgi:hypothetical protein
MRAIRLFVGLVALGFPMFSYKSCDGTQNQIDFVRLLCSDTQDLNHVFEDSEILGAYQIQAAQFQSSQFYSFAAGQNLPQSPVSYLRVSALLLDALAANKSRLASIKQLLDVRLDASDAAIQLRATAAQYRETDDNSGAFFIIEQVQQGDSFSFRDRFWAQVQRLSAGG